MKNEFISDPEITKPIKTEPQVEIQESPELKEFIEKFKEELEEQALGIDGESKALLTFFACESYLALTEKYGDKNDYVQMEIIKQLEKICGFDINHPIKKYETDGTEGKAGEGKIIVTVYGTNNTGVYEGVFIEKRLFTDGDIWWSLRSENLVEEIGATNKTDYRNENDL